MQAWRPAGLRQALLMRDSNTAVFLWILRIFKEQLFIEHILWLLLPFRWQTMRFKFRQLFQSLKKYWIRYVISAFCMQMKIVKQGEENLKIMILLANQQCCTDRGKNHARTRYTQSIFKLKFLSSFKSQNTAPFHSQW